MKVTSLWGENIPYRIHRGSEQHPTLTHYPVEGSRGAVIVCPGGGYGMLAPHEGAPVADRLNSFGISAYVLEYRIQPCHHMAPLADAKRAIRMVRSMGYEKVAIMGFSAGGHLTCSAGTLYDMGDPDNADPIEHISSRPDAFIPCYPVVTMSKDDFVEKGSRSNLLGEHSDDDKLRIYFSAEEQIAEDTPPAFIWTSSNDNCVHSMNALLLAASLRKKNIPFELHMYDSPIVAHGFGLGDEVQGLQTWSQLLGTWLIKEGFGKKE